MASLEGRWIAAALIPAALITVLFFFDHNVSAQLAQQVSWLCSSFAVICVLFCDIFFFHHNVLAQLVHQIIAAALNCPADPKAAAGCALRQYCLRVDVQQLLRHASGPAPFFATNAHLTCIPAGGVQPQEAAGLPLGLYAAGCAALCRAVLRCAAGF